MAPSVLTTSIGILRDKDPARRTRELRALRDHAPLDTLDAIISILETPEQDLRQKSVQSLSLFREHLESRAEAVAKNLVQNADPHVRLGCAILLMDNPSALVTTRRAVWQSRAAEPNQAIHRMTAPGRQLTIRTPLERAVMGDLEGSAAYARRNILSL